jgi:hypothetical protein
VVLREGVIKVSSKDPARTIDEDVKPGLEFFLAKFGDGLDSNSLLVQVNELALDSFSEVLKRIKIRIYLPCTGSRQ